MPSFYISYESQIAIRAGGGLVFFFPVPAMAIYKHNSNTKSNFCLIFFSKI